MIIGENRQAVIENIKESIKAEDFNAKVEIGDPVLTSQEERAITDGFLENRNKPSYKFKSFFARRIANTATKILNKETEIVGEFDKEALENGAIITSNHFSPVENTVIRYFILKNGKKRLNVVSQVTNFAMSGIIGFLLKYGDTIPISLDVKYFTRNFIPVLGDFLEKGEPVLIYPEQEMWFNYRKPRPFKKGAYYFCAKLGKPIISCFVEMIDCKEKDADEFYKVKYRLHILGTLYPDPEKSVRENSNELCERDFSLKKAAYERIYGKPLDYNFETTDIAGWTGK